MVGPGTGTPCSLPVLGDLHSCINGTEGLTGVRPSVPFVWGQTEIHLLVVGPGTGWRKSSCARRSPLLYFSCMHLYICRYDPYAAVRAYVVSLQVCVYIYIYI